MVYIARDVQKVRSLYVIWHKTTHKNYSNYVELWFVKIYFFSNLFIFISNHLC